MPRVDLLLPLLLCAACSEVNPLFTSDDTGIGEPATTSTTALATDTSGTVTTEAFTTAAATTEEVMTTTTSGDMTSTSTSSEDSTSIADSTGGSFCGDGNIDADEDCDDANAVEIDACNFACKRTPTVFAPPLFGATQQQGGPGGAAYDDSCADEGVLVGFAGALDDQGRIGAIHGVCSTISIGDDGSEFVFTFAAPYELPTQGAAVLQPWSFSCDPGSVIVGFRGRESSWVDQLVFRCAPLAIVVSPQGEYSVEHGVVVESSAVGDNLLGDPFPAEDCAVSGSGQRGGAGMVIDSFGLDCRDVTLLP